MKRIRALEEVVLRVEGALVVALVLLMLGLAAYNIFYRNVLASAQRYWAHSGPVVQLDENETAPVPPRDAEPVPNTVEPNDDEGFGGAFGKPAAPIDEEEAVEEEADDGFGGAFGKPKPKAADPEPAEADDFGDEGDPFEDLPEITADAASLTDEHKGGPPPAGSFAAWAVGFIDAIKVDWIDTFLPRLVIIVSFFGAALATGRRKHINIDALSRVLNAGRRRVMAVMTNLFAVIVCIMLAVAGKRLVTISMAYPSRLLPWVDEWVVQLMFPIGFAVLAFHFVVRLLEAAFEGPPPLLGEARRGGER
jgi:TRAP-type C4-dicarboxylate transport system permease small subunit